MSPPRYIPGEGLSFEDRARANLATVNEILAELIPAITRDAQMRDLMLGTLRNHSWSLGRYFMGEPPAPVAAAPGEGGLAWYGPGGAEAAAASAPPPAPGAPPPAASRVTPGYLPDGGGAWLVAVPGGPARAAEIALACLEAASGPHGEIFALLAAAFTNAAARHDGKEETR